MLCVCYLHVYLFVCCWFSLCVPCVCSFYADHLFLTCFVALVSTVVFLLVIVVCDCVCLLLLPSFFVCCICFLCAFKLVFWVCLVFDVSCLCFPSVAFLSCLVYCLPCWLGLVFVLASFLGVWSLFCYGLPLFPFLGFTCVYVGLAWSNGPVVRMSDGARWCVGAAAQWSGGGRSPLGRARPKYQENLFCSSGVMLPSSSLLSWISFLSYSGGVRVSERMWKYKLIRTVGLKACCVSLYTVQCSVMTSNKCEFQHSSSHGDSTVDARIVSQTLKDKETLFLNSVRMTFVHRLGLKMCVSIVARTLCPQILVEPVQCVRYRHTRVPTHLDDALQHQALLYRHSPNSSSHGCTVIL